MSKVNITILLLLFKLNIDYLKCSAQTKIDTISIEQFKSELDLIGKEMSTMNDGTYLLKTRYRNTELDRPEWTISEIACYYNAGTIVQKNDEGFLYRTDTIQIVVDIEEKALLIMRPPNKTDLEVFKKEYYGKIATNQIGIVHKLSDDINCSLKYKPMDSNEFLISLKYDCSAYYFKGFDYYVEDKKSRQYMKSIEFNFEYIGAEIKIDPSFFQTGYYIRTGDNGQLIAGPGFKDYEVFNTIIQ